MQSLNPVSSTGLRAFPPEIREMIFDFSNVLRWTGKTPALLVALRPDQELYTEALVKFYKHNVFMLHSSNEWKTGDMSPPALQSIKSLSIDFWSSDDWEDGYTPQVIEPCIHTFPNHPILQAQNIQDLTLDVSALPEFNITACVPPAVTCALRLSRLRRVVVMLPCVTSRCLDDPYDASGAVSALVGELNGCLGMAGKLLVVGAAAGTREAWFWELRQWKAIEEVELTRGAGRSDF